MMTTSSRRDHRSPLSRGAKTAMSARVLLVEDEVNMAKTQAKILQRRGYVVSLTPLRSTSSLPI
jgi:ActR/RegA family two-component response regulator